MEKRNSMQEKIDFPGFDKLFQIHDPLGNRPYRGKYEPYELALPLSRGESLAKETVHVTWQMGSGTPSDVIWASAIPIIVHERVINIFQRHNFTGWNTYSVEVQSKDGKKIPGYYGLSILGRCGSVDLSKSQIVLEEFPGGWFPQFLGHYFDQATWDGSDFFMESPDSKGKITSRRFITERVQRVLRKEKVSNLQMIALPEERTESFIYTIDDKYLLPSDFEARLSAVYRDAGVPRPAGV
jgi:hypothetical protein